MKYIVLRYRLGVKISKIYDLWERGIFMAEKFNGKKLLEAIVMTEEKVGTLYRKLASEVEDEKAKRLFENLAKDEDRHKKIYSALLERLPEEHEVELSEEEEEFTQILIDTNIVTNKNIEKRYSKYDALVLAEKVERDGIMFINQLQAIYPSLVEKEIKVILSEEKKHLKLVLNMQYEGNLSSLML